MYAFPRSLPAALLIQFTAGCLPSIAVGANAAPTRKPNILLLVVDDVPTFFYRDWDSKNPFRRDGVRPENVALDPEGSDIYIQHPVLDELMAGGVTFLNHYAQPTCGSDRAAMFSGLWAHRNGIGSPVAGAHEFNNFTHNGKRFDTAIPLATAVAAQGYTTGICGKWHLSAKVTQGGTGWSHVDAVGDWDWYASTFSNFSIDKKPHGGPRTRLSPIAPENGWSDLGDGRWQRTDPESFNADTLKFVFFDGVLSRKPQASEIAVDRPGEWFRAPGGTLTVFPRANGKLECSRRLMPGHYNFVTNRNGVIDLHQTGHAGENATMAAQAAGGFSGDVIFNDAETFVAQAEEPWFLAITTNSPHSPYDYPMPDTKVQTALYRQGPNTEPNQQSVWTNFCAQLEFLDARLGEFLNALDPETRSRTVVIWTSDNGAPQQVMMTLRDDPEHGLGVAGVGKTLSALIDSGEAATSVARFKSSPYEGGSRTPLVISGPAVAACMRGKKVQALSHTVDLYATVLALAGGNVPGISGVSQLPVLDGTRESVRDEVLMHQFRIDGTNGDHTALSKGPDPDNFDEMGYSLILTDQGPQNGRYKLIRKQVGVAPDRHQTELYQLEGALGTAVDLYEQVDLSGVEAYSAIEARMLQGLQRLLQT